VLVIALSGSLFHTLVGRTMRGYAATLGVSAVGFAAGEVFARLIESDGGRLGGVHLVHGVLGTWAAMGIWRWRARIKAEPPAGLR
jgi:hypothetical protein